MQGDEGEQRRFALPAGEEDHHFAFGPRDRFGDAALERFERHPALVCERGEVGGRCERFDGD
jgi:hypothetical protein